MATLKQRFQNQLDGIPQLNETFNRLPCSTKKWIIEGVTQAVKEWLTQKQQEWYEGKLPENVEDLFTTLLEELTQ
jgi:hypothetical protein